MKILLVIPSYNRPYIIDKYSLFWLKKCKFDWKIFVEPQQFKYYKQIAGPENLVQTENDCYKSGQLNMASEYAKANNYDLMFLIDDDMWFLKNGIKKSDAHLAVNDYLQQIVYAFESQPNLGIVSIGSYLQHKFVKEGDANFKSKNKDCCGAMVVRTELVSYPDDVNHYTDLYLQLNSLSKGYYSYIYNSIYQNTPDNSYGLEGGFQSFNRRLLCLSSFESIKKYYPEVKERTETKNPFLDIDISWYRDNFKQRK